MVNLDLMVVVRISSEKTMRLGTLHLTFEGLDPGQFTDYEESLMFPEWFCYFWLKNRSLLEITDGIRKAGGVVFSSFVNNFNVVDKVVGIETKPIKEIIRIG